MFTRDTPPSTRQLHGQKTWYGAAGCLCAFFVFALYAVILMRERAYDYQFRVLFDYGAQDAMIHFARQPGSTVLSAGLMLATALIIGVLLFARHRFSLRLLIGALILVGCAGACGPLVDRARKTVGFFDVRFTPTLTDEQFARLKNCMALNPFDKVPLEAKAVLSGDEWSELRAHTLTIEADQSYSVRVYIIFRPFESIDDRERLGRAYLKYFDKLTALIAGEQGNQPIPESSRLYKNDWIEH